MGGSLELNSTTSITDYYFRNYFRFQVFVTTVLVVCLVCACAGQEESDRVTSTDTSGGFRLGNSLLVSASVILLSSTEIFLSGKYYWNFLEIFSDLFSNIFSSRLLWIFHPPSSRWGNLLNWKHNYYRAGITEADRKGGDYLGHYIIFQ